MAKSLKDILTGVKKSKTEAGSTGEDPAVDYKSKSKGDQDFVAQHKTEKHADRVGNGDDVYNASKIKRANLERKGHVPDPKAKNVYKQANEEVEQLEEMPSQHRSSAGSGKNTNRNLSRLARKLAFEKPRYYRPIGELSKKEVREIGEKAVKEKEEKERKSMKKEDLDLEEKTKCESCGHNHMEGESCPEPHEMKKGKGGKPLKMLLGDKEGLKETAPPNPKLEKWIKSNKQRFIKEYGKKKGMEVLYAKAWKMHNEEESAPYTYPSGNVQREGWV